VPHEALPPDPFADDPDDPTKELPDDAEEADQPISDTEREELVEDYAVRLYRARFGTDAALPDYFVTAQTLTPIEHVRMQAALQRPARAAMGALLQLIGKPPDHQIATEAQGRSGVIQCKPSTPQLLCRSVDQPGNLTTFKLGSARILKSVLPAVV